jgi:hypothetical protein
MLQDKLKKKKKSEGNIEVVSIIKAKSQNNDEPRSGFYH